MWKDIAIAESLQAHAAHEAAARILGTAFVEHLMVDVKGRLSFAKEHAVAQPGTHQPGCPRITVVMLVITRLVFVEDQAHDVGRVPVVQPLLKRGVDHIIRRRDDIAQRADVPEVVADASECLDGGHKNIKRRVLVAEVAERRIIRPMTPEFYLVLKDCDLSDRLADAIFEAGFDDSSLTMHGGLAAVWIRNRKGELIDLVRVALAQARAGGLEVSHVAVE